VNPDPLIQKDKKTREKGKVKDIYVSDCWMFSFGGWRLLLKLGHPSVGLKSTAI
jgi:hypothetical protein